MAQTNVNIRIDDELKKQFEKFCSETGLTMTTAIAAFIADTVRNQQMAFPITTVKTENFKVKKVPVYEIESAEARMWRIKEMESSDPVAVIDAKIEVYSPPFLGLYEDSKSVLFEFERQMGRIEQEGHFYLKNATVSMTEEKDK